MISLSRSQIFKMLKTFLSAKKLWKGTSMDDKIKAFNDKFDHLISVMNNSVVLETGIVTLRASETSDELSEHINYSSFP